MRLQTVFFRAAISISRGFSSRDQEVESFEMDVRHNGTQMMFNFTQQHTAMLSAGSGLCWLMLPKVETAAFVVVNVGRNKQPHAKRYSVHASSGPMSFDAVQVAAPSLLSLSLGPNVDC